MSTSNLLPPDDGTPIIHPGNHHRFPGRISRRAPSGPSPLSNLASAQNAYSMVILKRFGSDSDGPQPHFITIEFPRKVAIQKLSIHLNFPQDDSYTPSTLAIRAGTGQNDLQDVRVVTLDKPDGWITFDISSEPNPEGDGFNPVYAYVLQIIVAANHMSGKDTHVRGLRVLGPLEDTTCLEEEFPFYSQQFKMYETLR